MFDQSRFSFRSRLLRSRLNFILLISFFEIKHTHTNLKYSVIARDRKRAFIYIKKKREREEEEQRKEMEVHKEKRTRRKHITGYDLVLSTRIITLSPIDEKKMFELAFFCF